MATAIPRPPAKIRLLGFINVSDWKLRTKLLIAFIIAAFLPLGSEAYTAITASTRYLLAQGTTNLVSHSTSTSNAIDQYLISHREDIVSLSLLQSMVAYVTNPSDAQLKTNALKELISLSNKKHIESIAIMDSNGVITLSSSDADINTNVQFRPYFLEAMKGNAGYISDPSVSVVTGQPAIFFSAPILDSGGNIKGAIRSRLSLYGIWDLVEADKDSAGPGTFGILLDENGIRIASSQSSGNREQIVSTVLYAAVVSVPADVEKTIVSEKRFGNATASSVRVLPLPEVASALSTPGVTTFETTADNSTARHYAAITTLSIKPWHYVLMTPLSVFTGASDELSRNFMIQALVIAAILIIAVLIIARSITQPIIELTKVADRISLGELDAKIDINRKDEIGELAESVSRMQASLQAAIERLRARRTNQ